MKKTTKTLTKGIICFFLILISYIGVIAQTPDDNFKYDEWPGKDGEIKHEIKLSAKPFLGYGLKLEPIRNDSTIQFDIPISKDDTVKLGRYKLRVCATVEKAQLFLLNHLFSIQSNTKPPMLEKEKFPYGDVAFGWERGEAFSIYCCVNNVFVIIETVAENTIALAAKTDSIVKASPVWSAGKNKPAFELTGDFCNTFFATTP